MTVVAGSQNEPEYVAETLAWCNAKRAEVGTKPLTKLPKGVIGQGSSCPCGKATSLYVGRTVYRADLWSPAIGRLPAPVMAFVDAFDSGHLLQYEAKA